MPKKNRLNVRFSETEGINYEMVYDSETCEEITSLYELKYIANKIDLDRQKLENYIIKTAPDSYRGEVIKEILNN